MRIAAVIFFLALFAGACETNTKKSTENKKGIAFSGIFVREEKLNDRQHKLYLKDSRGDTIEFISNPFFGEAEIPFLKKDGKPNVFITYDNFDNPVRKKTEKIVRSIHPVYDAGAGH